MAIKRQSLAQLFRYVQKVETQVALLRLDLQAARVLPKTKIELGCVICGSEHGGLPCPETAPMCSATLETPVEYRQTIDPPGGWADDTSKTKGE